MPGTAPNDHQAKTDSGWHNHLPAWIRQSPSFSRLNAAQRFTLQTIADTCNPADNAGNLLGARGGVDLIRRCGCSRASFWRHLNRLEQFGFVVTTVRGGIIGDQNVTNQYAIPGEKSALDEARMYRQQQRMIRGADGVLRPEIMRPNQQPTIWSGSEPAPNDVQKTRGGSSQNETGGSLKMRRGSSQNETGGSLKMRHYHHGLSPNEYPLNHGSDGACSKRGSNAGVVRAAGDPVQSSVPTWRRVRIEDLQDCNRLTHLIALAVDRKWITDSEHDELRLFAAAEHALRCGDRNPCGMFAAMVRNGRWLMLTDDDYDAGNKRLKDYHHGT